jgi:hypothetical protein
MNDIDILIRLTHSTSTKPIQPKTGQPDLMGLYKAELYMAHKTPLYHKIMKIDSKIAFLVNCDSIIATRQNVHHVLLKGISFLGFR